jgi:F0F1-type ATP synthase alpha subunit
VATFEKEFQQYMKDHKANVRTEISQKKELTPELKTALTDAISHFKASFLKAK